MRIRKVLATLSISAVALVGTSACAQQGCFDDDGDQVSCNQNYDDDDDDDDWGDDD